MSKSTQRTIYIMGARGFNVKYGGWETFVTQLMAYWPDESIQFIIPELCTTKPQHPEKRHGSLRLPQIYVKPMGSATMVVFAAKALMQAIRTVRREHLHSPIFYVLGLRIGPLALFQRANLRRLGITVLINPDGLEWQRAKWNKAIKKYFLWSEKTMVKASDHVVADNPVIQRYMIDKYPELQGKTSCIAYGATVPSTLLPFKETRLLEKFPQLQPHDYYLIVGRFVPENNYELILREYKASSSQKPLVIITNVERNAFYDALQASTDFESDPRILVVGPQYDQRILTSIRAHALAYLHGHSAGGTNPSLLEALATTSVNVVYDVSFNREVAQDAALYFTNESGSLRVAMAKTEAMSASQRQQMADLAKARIQTDFSWTKIVNQYQALFDRFQSGESA
jgi:rhamnosyltransferase